MRSRDSVYSVCPVTSWEPPRGWLMSRPQKESSMGTGWRDEGAEAQSVEVVRRVRKPRIKQHHGLASRDTELTALKIEQD